MNGYNNTPTCLTGKIGHRQQKFRTYIIINMPTSTIVSFHALYTDIDIHFGESIPRIFDCDPHAITGFLDRQLTERSSIPCRGSIQPSMKCFPGKNS